MTPECSPSPGLAVPGAAAQTESEPQPASPPPALPSRGRRTRTLTLVSFGFKYGPPPANHFFDVSFLSNPARDPRWDLFSEPDEAMRAFVLEQPAAREFLQAAEPLVALLARLDDDARVALGCSAGRHRSAILAEELGRRLRAGGVAVRVLHREEAQA